jgi:uncharacterized protein
VSVAGHAIARSHSCRHTTFNRLADTEKKHEPTLEDLIRETPRPMLKLRLDENLPSLVERMLQSEIERAARGF